MVIILEIDLSLEAAQAFDLITEELVGSLSRLGMQFVPGVDGNLVFDSFVVGRVLEWQRPRLISMEWRSASWTPDIKTSLKVRFERSEPGTRVIVEHSGMDSLLNEDQVELAGWFASSIIAKFMQSIGPNSFGDWLTDRRARRPSGKSSREFYRDPIYHRPNFIAILKELNLSPHDYLIDVGCGGGAFLHDALLSGCKAFGIDHSEEMVSVARQNNEQAILDKRLEIVQGDAGSLSLPDGTFTCAVMTGVLGFIENPVQAFSEIRRVLVDGGRFVAYTATKALKGTPAAPEPMASKLHFYEDSELENLAQKAGFSFAKVEHPDLFEYAKSVGVPEEALPMFNTSKGSAPADQLLVAIK